MIVTKVWGRHVTAGQGIGTRNLLTLLTKLGVNRRGKIIESMQMLKTASCEPHMYRLQLDVREDNES